MHQVRRGVLFMKLSIPQQKVLQYGIQGLPIAVNSAPGSGKSYILKRLASELPNKRGLSLSFNNSTAKEAKDQYPTNFDVFTANALALDKLNPEYANQLGPIGAWDIVDTLNIQPSSFADQPTMGFYVLQTLNNFCNSADSKLNLSHAPDIFDVNEEMTRQTKYKLACMAGQVFEMSVDLNSKMPVPHNVYLKLFQLNKVHLGYDVVFVDEAQDTNPVIWDIVKNQEGSQIVLVGDQFQQLNRFRGAMNVMNMLPNAKHINMNDSWRFGPAVAAVANTYLHRHFAVDYRVNGNPDIQSKIGRLNEMPKLHLYRTNMGMLSGVLDKSLAGHAVNVVGGVDEMTSIIKGCYALKNGKKPKAPELRRFRSYDQFMSFTGTKAGKHMKKFVKITEKHDQNKLLDVLETVKQNKKNALVFSTVHKAKGLEAESAYIGPDFIPPDDKRYTKDEMNAGYVAVTRAVHLDESNIRNHIMTFSSHYLEQTKKIKETKEIGQEIEVQTPTNNTIMDVTHEDIQLSPSAPAPF